MIGDEYARARRRAAFADTLRFTLANRGAEVKLECNSQQLAQMTLADVMPGIGVADLKELFRPIIEGEKPEIVFETTIRSVTNKTYPAELCVQYFSDEVPNILVVIVHDTTERRQLAAE